MTIQRLQLCALSLFMLLGVPAQAAPAPSGSHPTEAQEGSSPPEVAWRAPQHRVFYRSVTGLGSNPEGLGNKLDVGYRYRLFDSDSILTRDSFAGLGLSSMITPTFAQVGVSAQVQPLAVLFLEARWKHTSWFGNLGHVQTYSDAEADFSDDAVAAQGDTDESFATTSWEADLIAELRAKIGPVVLRNRTVFMRTELAPPKRPDDTLYYDPIYDLLMPTSGWSSTNSADILWMLRDDRLILGVRHTSKNSYRDDSGSDVPHNRVGPVMAYRFSSQPGARFDAPTVLAMVQWHTKHRYRAGQVLPYVLIAFAFQGDLLSTLPP